MSFAFCFCVYASRHSSRSTSEKPPIYTLWQPKPQPETMTHSEKISSDISQRRHQFDSILYRLWICAWLIMSYDVREAGERQWRRRRHWRHADNANCDMSRINVNLHQIADRITIMRTELQTRIRMCSRKITTSGHAAAH